MTHISSIFNLRGYLFYYTIKCGSRFCPSVYIVVSFMSGERKYKGLIHVLFISRDSLLRFVKM